MSENNQRFNQTRTPYLNLDEGGRELHQIREDCQEKTTHNQTGRLGEVMRVRYDGAERADG